MQDQGKQSVLESRRAASHVSRAVIAAVVLASRCNGLPRHVRSFDCVRAVCRRVQQREIQQWPHVPSLIDVHEPARSGGARASSVLFRVCGMIASPASVSLGSSGPELRPWPLVAIPVYPEADILQALGIENNASHCCCCG